MKHLIGYSRNRFAVYVDMLDSPARRTISRQPHLLSLAAEALEHSVLKVTTPILEHNLGRVIGYDFIVATTSEDNVFYAQLIKDTVYTRFTKKGEPTPANYVTLIMQYLPEEKAFYLQDIWIGRFRPVEPGRQDETHDSVAYWKKHAVVFQNQPMQTQTLTRDCPY